MVILAWIGFIALASFIDWNDQRKATNKQIENMFNRRV